MSEMEISRGVRIALEGCGHGKLHDIYAKVTEGAKAKGWDGVDLVIIGGDFQSVRNANDLNGMSVPIKYREIGDFHEYYSGKATAPYLTIFVGGNHEASNYLFELYYGGWVAPNIYYMGASNVLRFGPLRIAGLSGIWKGYDYNRPHFERLPYNEDDVKSIYHVRELDVRKLMQIRTQVDVGLSHDWPRGVELNGNYHHLFRIKPFFREDSNAGTLGSTAAKHVLDRLRPPHWFSAHLHVRYNALISHGDYQHPRAQYVASQRKQPFAHGMDGTSDTVDAPPTTNSNQVPGRQQNTLNNVIQAWNNFGKVAAQQEVEDQAKFLRQQAEWDPNRSLNVQNIPATFKQIMPDDYQRKIVTVEGPPADQGNGVVKNSAEIDLDLDSEEETSGKNNEDNRMEVDSKPNTEITSEPKIEPESVPQEENQQETAIHDESNPEAIPEALREQLPDAFKRPTHETPVYGPLPVGISNKHTNFLALGKCQNGSACHEYLELMELFPISGEDEMQPPFSLQYDKEWLAITRVFANSLELGNLRAHFPADLGDEKYKEQIEKEEAWVQEHVVEKEKLTIPHNFEITAPVYDPSVPIHTKDMPPEYNNPQTAAFCDLVGIDNKFHLTPEERERRTLDGPRPSRGGHSHWQSRRGRHNVGGRGGGGRGRGRGGRGRAYY
ncbi:RNA lariat debranching enzyme, putative [Talaromyces stipitatus ATCC 10500]|uniref:RNA lariat debranching enzyme, putative n=1 Tax=Talaromyces stipitatus (strain ATCC 10500 / CBS 375.48 / QM 6759 / NRRL 1006) TaxID=441959 RepID=B8MQ66_TALSN|nr:RNA lariat debranching enzyme, putative [Talaromyces stipitatus ATCC 10500]EED13135.1 RNA lariat debranching enzyme, putative [Talaromyces stipitatus ATCC 10500]